MILHSLENKWAKSGAMLGLLVGAALLTFYLAGYFFLWKIKASPFSATPFTVVDYWVHYGHQAHVLNWLMWSLAGGAIPAVGVLAAMLTPKKRSMHGDASFANSGEIEKAGLKGTEGIILGRHGSYFPYAFLGSYYLMLPGQLSVMVEAAPRSGKGSGILQPNNLNHPGSTVTLDVRKESFRETSGYRAEFSDVFLFDPLARDRATCQWNPLTYVSEDPVMQIDDLQKIANMLSPDPPDGDPFWPASCRTLFLGLALYLFETPGLPRTFGEIVRQIMYGEGETVGEHWVKIIEARDQAGTPLSGVCKAALYDFIYTSSATQSSIRKTFTSKLELWLNPLIDQATSGNSFDMRQLRRKRMSVYVGVKYGDIKRLKLLLNLFFQQMIDLNTDVMPEDDPTLKHKLLLGLDEFPLLGRMPVFEDVMGVLGGFNILAILLYQSGSQLRSVYGEHVAETMHTCMGASITFAPRDQRRANEVSEALGDTTVESESRSKPVMAMNGGSVNTSETARRLLKPQEVRALGKEREIIFIENVKPILAYKIRHFKERAFKERKRLPAFVKRLPPPVLMPGVVRPPKASAPAGVTVVMGNDATGKPEKAQTTNIARPIAPADMAKLDTLSLSDFDTSFEKIDIPKGEPLSDREMQVAVDSFLESMMD